jgi:aspartate oxidase
MQNINYVKTDVLVIGGGIAGMMAAIAAKGTVPKVTIVSKGPVAKSGNTLVSGGWLSSATKEPGNSPEKFYEDVIASGKGLNFLKLARKLAADSPMILEILEKNGVKLLKNNNSYIKSKMPGHSVPRSVTTEYALTNFLNKGLSFTLPLLERLKELNVSVYNGITIIKLVKEGRRIIGAWGVDGKKDLWYFQSGSTVLAAGGGGHLYGKSNNTSDITGDSYSLALDVGCSLIDMEQIQFYPSMMFKPFKAIISNALFNEGARLLNSSLEEFMWAYDPAGNMATRDVMSRAVYSEITAGRGIGDNVYIDCSPIEEQILTGLHGSFYNFFQKKGIDPKHDLILITSCVHFFLGGIRIDENCRTDVPGLYACGEASGGVHGCNRLAGNALMEACVFGWEAGQTAAQEVQHSNVAPAVPDLSVAKEEGIHFVRQLREEMWKKTAIIRNGENLNNMLKIIRDCRNMISLSCSSNCSAIENMFKVAEAITLSAIARKESRGAHFREDYPHQSSEYCGNIECVERDSEIKASRILP